MSVLGNYLVQSWLMRERQDFAQQQQRQVQQGVQGLLGQAPVMREVAEGRHGPPEQLSAGSGLLADPTNLERQLTFGAGLMGLPGMGQAGSSMVQGLFGEGYADRRAEARLAQQAGQWRADTERAQENWQQTFDRDTYYDQQADSRAQLAHTQNTYLRDLQIEGAQLQAEAAGREAELRAIGKPAQAPPSGYRYAFAPGEEVMAGARPPGPQDWAAVPLPGTKDWQEGFETTTLTERALQDMDALQELVENTGTEAWGERSGEMNTIWQRLLAYEGTMKGLGTLQPSDLEFLEAGLPNPGTWGGAFKRTGTILASLAQVRANMLRQQGWNRQRYRGWGLAFGDYDAPAAVRRRGLVPATDEQRRRRAGRAAPTPPENPATKGERSRNELLRGLGAN